MKQKDRNYLAKRLADAHAPKRVGDRVEGKHDTTTTIVRIVDDIAELANGERVHVSRLRRIAGGS